MIAIDTVFGRLSAEASADPNYPGITICIEQEEDGVKYDKQLALVECTPDHPVDGGHALRLLVWNSDHDDYTDDFTFMEKTPVEDESALWEKYLHYLREWTFSHKEIGFIGMAPTCFTEWCCSEYTMK